MLKNRIAKIIIENFSDNIEIVSMVQSKNCNRENTKNIKHVIRKGKIDDWGQYYRFMLTL